MKRSSSASKRSIYGLGADESDDSFGTPSGSPVTKSPWETASPANCSAFDSFCDDSQVNFEFSDYDQTLSLDRTGGPLFSMTKGKKGGPAKGGGGGITPIKHVEATTTAPPSTPTTNAPPTVGSTASAGMPTITVSQVGAPVSSTNVFLPNVGPDITITSIANAITTTSKTGTANAASQAANTASNSPTPPTLNLTVSGMSNSQLRTLKLASNTSIVATYDWISMIQKELSAAVDSEKTTHRLRKILEDTVGVETGLAFTTNAYMDAVRPFQVSRAVEVQREVKQVLATLEVSRNAMKIRLINYDHTFDTDGDASILRARERTLVSTSNLEDVRVRSSVENEIAIGKTGSLAAVHATRNGIWYQRTYAEVKEAMSHLEATRLHLLELIEHRIETVEDHDLAALLIAIAAATAEAAEYIAPANIEVRHDAPQGVTEPVGVTLPLQPAAVVTPPLQPAAVSQTYAAVSIPAVSMHNLTVASAFNLNEATAANDSTVENPACQNAVSTHDLTILLRHATGIPTGQPSNG
jgi:hypothetical protein